MQSRGIDHGGQFPLALQAHVAEQSSRTMRELIQEIVHALLDLGPVLDPAMHLEDVLAQPAPQFLNGIEPGGIGRQPHRLDAGVGFQGRQHVGMRVNVPVILDHINQLHLLGVGAIQAGIELDHLLSAHDVAIEVVHLSGQGIERADRAPLLIVARALRHRGFPSPGRRDFRPALIAKLIQKQCHHGVRVPRGVAQTAVQPAYLAAVVGIRTEQAGTRGVKSQPTALQHAPDATHGVLGEPVHRRPNRAQGPAARRRATRWSPPLPDARLHPVRRAVSPRSSSLTASTSSKYPPAVPTLLVGDQTRNAFLFIDL